MYDEKNTECALYGTEECALLNASGCLGCSVGKMNESDQRSMKNGLSRLREAAPEETVLPLYTSDTCLLCKGEEGSKGRAECYALFDMSKEDPAGDWSFNIGKKKLVTKTGFMLLPLQVSSCKSCRRRYHMAEFLPIVASLVIAALGLVIATVKPVYNKLYTMAAWAPAAVFAGSVVIALVAGRLLRSALIKSFGKHTEFDMSNIPQVAELEARGWKQAAKDEKHGFSKLVFAKLLRREGVYSRVPGQPEEETGDRAE